MTSKASKKSDGNVSNMSLRLEQRYAIKFCYRLKESPKNTLKLLNLAYGEKTISSKQVMTWYRAFQGGRETCETMMRSGRPVTVSEEIIGFTAAIINEDARMTLKELSFVLNVPRTSVYSILKKNLDLAHVCSRWVPRLLTAAQKNARVEACKLWKKKVEENGKEWLHSLIIVDEAWLYCFNVDEENGIQPTKKGGGKRPKHESPYRFVSKVQVLIFFDYHGMVLVHSLPKDTIYSGSDYLDALNELVSKSIPTRRPELIGKWNFFYNIAHRHIAVSLTDFLGQNGISFVAEPANSPDLTPSDFFLYPALKKRFKGLEFVDKFDTLEAVEEVLNALPKNEYKDAFDEWQKRWDACIYADGEYIHHGNTYTDGNT